MQLLRIPNYFFVGLRLGFALVMTSLYLGVVLFAPAPDPADKDGFDKGIFAVLMPFVIIPFIIAAVRAIVRVELNGGLVVRRLLWTRRYDWKDVTGLAFTTSTGSFSFIPVAKFRSANFNFQSGGRLYVRVTPQEERSITSFLAAAGIQRLLNPAVPTAVPAGGAVLPPSAGVSSGGGIAASRDMV